jgi:valyl-tRNA synthetase
MAAVEMAGDIIVDAASTVRGWKSEEGMALNTELSKVEIYPDEMPEDRAVDTYDLSEAVNGPVLVREGVPSVELVPVDIDPDHSVIGPKFRDQAGQVVGQLESMDPADIQRQIDIDGEIEIDLGDEGEALRASEESSGAEPREVAVIPGDAVDIIEEHRAESGEEVVVLESERSTILIYE